MPQIFTVKDVLERLASERESEEPDAVLAVLKAHDGKPLTRRLLAKLPGGKERWCIHQIADMTNLDDRDYLHSQGNRGIHLLMAYQLTSVVIDAAWVEQHNPAYFKGRRERNADRDACAKNPALCQKLADALTGYARAKELLEAAREILDGLTEHGKPFSPDRCDWQRLCGAYFIELGNLDLVGVTTSRSPSAG